MNIEENKNSNKRNASQSIYQENRKGAKSNIPRRPRSQMRSSTNEVFSINNEKLQNVMPTGPSPNIRRVRKTPQKEIFTHKRSQLSNRIPITNILEVTIDPVREFFDLIENASTPIRKKIIME